MSNAKTAESDERRRAQLLEFTARAGIEFKNLELLNRALTHSSYTKFIDSTAENNETLEFLGDAVVELATSSYLYKHFRGMSEGDLTRSRAALVCQDSLSKVAERLGVGELLILGPSENNRTGRSRPSTLEDAFEAIVGALYLDRGWTIAHKFVQRELSDGFKALKRGKMIVDFKSHLQELLQREQGHVIEYVELKNYGPDHDKTFECAVKIDGRVLGRGVGKSKQRAEQAAAEEALKVLEPEFEDDD